MATQGGKPLLRTLPGGSSRTAGLLGKPMPLQLAGPAGTPLPKEIPVGRAPAGRPPSNLGRYLIKPTPDSHTGFEMLNEKPELLQEVQKKFLKLKLLPPGLAPTRLRDPKYTDRPDVLEAGRRTNISKGFNDPRGRKG